jgi:hypothetical protein
LYCGKTIGNTGNRTTSIESLRRCFTPLVAGSNRRWLSEQPFGPQTQKPRALEARVPGNRAFLLVRGPKLGPYRLYLHDDSSNQLNPCRVKSRCDDRGVSTKLQFSVAKSLSLPDSFRTGKHRRTTRPYSWPLRYNDGSIFGHGVLDFRRRQPPPSIFPKSALNSSFLL